VWQRPLRSVLAIGVIVALLGGAFWKPISVAWSLRGARNLLRERDSEGAVSVLVGAHRIDANNPEVNYLLARSYRRLGKFGRVAEHLDVAEGYGWPAELIRLEQLMGAAQAGQLNASAPELYKFLSRGGDYGDEGPEVCEALVNGYFLSYQFGLAQPLLDEWQSAYPDDAQCYMFRGLFYENRANPGKAVAEYRKAVLLSGTRTDVRLRLAEVLKKTIQYDEAIAQFEACRLEDTSHPEVLTGLGQCYHGQGEIDRAREMFEEVLASDPGHFEAQLALGQLEETAGRPQQALRWLRPACRLRPSDTEARYSLALSLQAVGRRRSDRSARLQDGGSAISVAGALLLASRRAEAELTLSEAAYHFQFVADAQQAMGRVQVWTDIIRSEPRNADLRFKIGSHLMKYDNPQHGLGWLLSVLDIDAGHVATHRLLAEYYSGKGKTERAAFHAKHVEQGGQGGQGGAGGGGGETGVELDTQPALNPGEG